MKLETIILSNNELNNLPNNLHHLQNLKHLDISKNKLEVLPVLFGNLFPQLQEFKYSGILFYFYFLYILLYILMSIASLIFTLENSFLPLFSLVLSKKPLEAKFSIHELTFFIHNSNELKHLSLFWR